MKLLYHGDLSEGTTSLHRFEALAELGCAQMIAHAARLATAPRTTLLARARWRLGWPSDLESENERLLAAASAARPDVVYVDNSRVITVETLRDLRRRGARALVYYSPDDMMARHNLSRPLARSLTEWDLVFTTKTFNVAELTERGVRRARLIGNSYHPSEHRPLSAQEAGPDFERFDIVFAGAFERARARALLVLAREGMSVVVYGGASGLMQGSWRSYAHPGLTLRPNVYGLDYARALHHGKVAVCFLRKINRDRITTRSIEIPACARPMLAEKTDEHDAHFIDGEEYVGFASEEDLLAKARVLLADDSRRARIAAAGRARCLASGYATADRARTAMDEIEAVLSEAQPPC